jgi:hypothetical protein
MRSQFVLDCFFLESSFLAVGFFHHRGAEMRRTESPLRLRVSAVGFPHSVQGLTTDRPQCSKSHRLRVARVPRRERVIAAIMASNWEMGRPRASRRGGTRLHRTARCVPGNRRPGLSRWPPRAARAVCRPAGTVFDGDGRNASERTFVSRTIIGRASADAGLAHVSGPEAPRPPEVQDGSESPPPGSAR